MIECICMVYPNVCPAGLGFSDVSCCEDCSICDVCCLNNCCRERFESNCGKEEKR
jgi:hypothetical protein